LALRIGATALVTALAALLAGCDAHEASDVLPAVGADTGTGARSLGQAGQVLAAKEYAASRNRIGLQAPNRAHDLRTYFLASGIRVHERSTAAGRELLALSLTGVGRGEALASVAPGEVVSDGARVEIRRPDLVEWYENSRAGLEQGFTLARRPPGDGELVLELAVSGAQASHRGERVVFASETGRPLHYGKLAVFDALGSRRAARLEVPEASRLRIVVNDGGAVYPLVIDPVLAATAHAQLESDQADALLGFSVAGAGDVNGDGYDDVIVGAYHYDAGEADEGAAFVFLGSPSGIANGDPSTAAALIQSNQAGAEFGISVAGAGDVDGDGYDDVIVGARFYDDGETDEGAAFVFRGGASGVSGCTPGSPPLCAPSDAVAQLESNQAFALLGAGAAGAGDVDGDGYADVIVGAYLYDNGQEDEGAAFVFLGGASGISGCAPGSPPRCAPGDAAAQLESNQAFALLGLDVGGAGDVDSDGYDDLIVGSPLYDAGQSNEGAAFVFLGSASGVVGGDPGTAAAQLESEQADANFGFSVATAGDVDADGYADVIVGADEYDADESGEGAAFVFLGSASGISACAPGTPPRCRPSDAAAQLEANQEGADFGISVAGAGDVDSDGYDDVIVGAHLYDSGQTDEGAAFVFLGDSSGIADGTPIAAAARLQVDQADSGFGRSVAGAGDVDADGYADVIVGAPTYDSDETDEGVAFIFLRGTPRAAIPALSGLGRVLLAALVLAIATRSLRVRRFGLRASSVEDDERA
jgi:hypothetical protein